MTTLKIPRPYLLILETATKNNVCVYDDSLLPVFEKGMIELKLIIEEAKKLNHVGLLSLEKFEEIYSEFKRMVNWEFKRIHDKLLNQSAR